MCFEFLSGEFLSHRYFEINNILANFYCSPERNKKNLWFWRFVLSLPWISLRWRKSHSTCFTELSLNEEPSMAKESATGFVFWGPPCWRLERDTREGFGQRGKDSKEREREKDSSPPEAHKVRTLTTNLTATDRDGFHLSRVAQYPLVLLSLLSSTDLTHIRLFPGDCPRVWGRKTRRY